MHLRNGQSAQSSVKQQEPPTGIVFGVNGDDATLSGQIGGNDGVTSAAASSVQLVVPQSVTVAKLVVNAFVNSPLLVAVAS